MPTIDVTVIDSAGGTASFHAQHTYPGSILANSVWTMVDGILERLRSVATDLPEDPAALRLLRIVGHGSPGRQGMGDSRFTTNRRQLIMLDTHGHLLNQSVLVLLRGHFAPDAVVELHGCSVGAGARGANLIRALKQLWGARVRAGVIDQDAGTPYIDHFIRMAHPN